MPQKDMFLKLESARSGLVRGEARDAAHDGEIVVLDWSWGMTSGATMGAGPATRTALSELRVVKQSDTATTALLSVMRNNDQIKKAVLSVRKAGDRAIDYMIVTIQRGRITSYEIDSAGDLPLLTEVMTMAFEEIEIEYHAQDARGARLASSSFTAEVGGARR